MKYRIYVICHRDTGGIKHEPAFFRAAVLVAEQPPDVLTLRTGAIFELEPVFESKEEAYRWWIKEESQLTFPVSGMDITR